MARISCLPCVHDAASIRAEIIDDNCGSWMRLVFDNTGVVAIAVFGPLARPEVAAAINRAMAEVAAPQPAELGRVAA